MNYSSGFNAQTLLNNFLNSMPENVQVMLTITAITGQYINNSYTGTAPFYQGLIEYYYRDIINCSMQIKTAGASSWSSPATWLTQLADAGINFTGMVENVSAVLITNAIANMNLELLEANYNNFEFTSWISGWYSNATCSEPPYAHYDPEGFFSGINVVLPAYPFAGHFGDMLSWMILPQGYDFSQMETWLETAYPIVYDYDLIHGGSPENDLSTSDLLSALNQTGITVTVQPRALAISQSWSAMAQNTNWFRNMVGNLTLMGLTMSGEDFYSGVEFSNSSGMLNAWATYFDASFDLNLTAISPSLAVSAFSISGFITITSNNTTPIQKSDIQQGKIGTARTGSGPSIPGYSVDIVGIVGIVSVTAIIVKTRKMVHK